MDSGTPPFGFYSVSWQTVSDSCQPRRPERTSEEVVGSTEKLVSVVLSTDHRHQDIQWNEPFFFTSSECGLSISLEVVSKSATSFVVDSQIDWVGANRACEPWAFLGIPSGDCSVHQTVTYELNRPCPSKNLGSCP